MEGCNIDQEGFAVPEFSFLDGSAHFQHGQNFCFFRLKIVNSPRTQFWIGNFDFYCFRMTIRKNNFFRHALGKVHTKRKMPHMILDPMIGGYLAYACAEREYVASPLRLNVERTAWTAKLRRLVMA